MNEKKIDFFIRVDANLVLGTGHLMRCLTLALILKKMKYNICSISSFLNKHLSNHIKKQGFQFKTLSNNYLDNSSKKDIR